MLYNAIDQINHYPVDKCYQMILHYLLDSDLFGGQRYPTFEQVCSGLIRILIQSYSRVHTHFCMQNSTFSIHFFFLFQTQNFTMMHCEYTVTAVQCGPTIIAISRVRVNSANYKTKLSTS